MASDKFLCPCKNFEIIIAKTMDLLKEELIKFNKSLDETKNDKFIKEIDTFSIVYNPDLSLFQAMVMISSRFNKNYNPEEKPNQTPFKEKDKKFKNSKPNNKKEDIVTKFFKEDTVTSEAKERMYQKQKRKGKFNK